MTRFEPLAARSNLAIPYVRSHSNANQAVYPSKTGTDLKLWTTTQTNVCFADSATNQTFPTHSRAWRIKRSKPIPETTPKTPIPLTLISSLRSENSKKNRKTVRVKFSFKERAIQPDGQVSESVISFDEPNEYWKHGALYHEPLYVMNCRTTR